MSVLITFILPKISSKFINSNIVKLHSDIALIRSNINKNIQNKIILNSNRNLNTLDDNTNFLFNLILKKPIKSKPNDGGNWSKISQNIYYAWIDSTTGIKFIYNNNTNSFECNLQQKYCKKLSQ
jgi:hypothetical protein